MHTQFVLIHCERRGLQGERQKRTFFCKAASYKQALAQVKPILDSEGWLVFDQQSHSTISDALGAEGKRSDSVLHAGRRARRAAAESA